MPKGIRRTSQKADEWQKPSRAKAQRSREGGSSHKAKKLKEGRRVYKKVSGENDRKRLNTL